jgi:hypothetical protein
LELVELLEYIQVQFQAQMEVILYLMQSQVLAVVQVVMILFKLLKMVLVAALEVAAQQELT